MCKVRDKISRNKKKIFPFLSLYRVTIFILSFIQHQLKDKQMANTGRTEIKPS